MSHNLSVLLLFRGQLLTRVANYIVLTVAKAKRVVWSSE